MKVLRRAQFVVGVVVGAVAAGGIAFAAIPNKSTGQITACYGTDKILKVADTVCPKGTTKLTWQSKGVRYMGAWSSFVSYQPNDIVTRNGASYVAKKASKAKAVTNTTYWAVLAAKGDTGAQGETGASGPRYGRTIVATQTLDSTGDVGAYTSLAIGVGGNPVISYFDNSNANLKVTACSNPTCSATPTTTTVDDELGVGTWTSIAIGSDGNPVVSYQDFASSRLKLAACNNPMCTSATINFVDSAGQVGSYSSLAIGVDGNPVIGYFDLSNDSLKVAACDNPKCTSATTTTLDSAGDVGSHTSLTIGSNGNPIVSYFDETKADLKVAACDNPKCTSATTTTLDSAGQVGSFTSIAVGADGNPVISYYDLANGDLKVAACTNPTCTTTPTITTVDSDGVVGFNRTSITIGVDGNPAISYLDNINENLKLAICTNPTCTSADISTLDSNGFVGIDSSITVGASGNFVVSYTAAIVNDLKIAVVARSSWTKNGWGR